MKYIDIDSNYRNRNKFPNQAQFQVLREQNHLCDTSCLSLQEGISRESVLYPNPQQNQLLAYYEENIQEPINTILSRPNLPYMFSTNTTTIYQLDELVLASTDSTTTNVTENALYPRGTIPLGQANEFYTGDYLEDVENKEFRLITAFRYDDSIDNVFQNGNVQDATTFVDGSSFITVNTSSLTQLPFSNIDRFYQGKFLKMLNGNASGEKRLIINYTASTPNQYTFKLQSSFGVQINSGNLFAIVSDRKWFATVDKAFTNIPSSYPCFRNLVVGNISWTQNILSDNYSDVEFLRVYRQGIEDIGAQNMGLDILVDNGTTSLGGDALGDISHLISSDQNGQFGFTEIFKKENVIVKSRFGSAYVQSFSVFSYIPSENITPKIIYAEASTSNANNWSVRLLFGFDKDGYIWDDTTTIVSYTSGSVIDQNICAIASVDNTTLFGAWGVFNGVDYDLVFYDGTSDTVIYNNTDIIQTVDMEIINGNPAIYFRLDNEFRFIRATAADGSSWGSPVQSNQNNETTYFDHSLTEIDQGGGTTRPYATSDTPSGGFSPNTIFRGVNASGTSFSTTFYLNFRFNRTRLIQAEVNGNDFPILVATDEDNNRLWFLAANTNNFFTNNDFFNGLNLIDTNVVSAIDMTTNYNNEPIIIYTRMNGSTTEIVSLNLSGFIAQSSSTYRIRQGIPTFYGSPLSNSIVSSTTTTLTLPSSINVDDDFFNCMYLHLTNFPFVQLDTSITYNDFLYITNYESSTNTITFSPPLTTAPSTIEATSFGDYSVFFLDMSNSSNIGEDMSPNGYDYTVNGDASYEASYTDINGLTLNDVMSTGTMFPFFGGLSKTYTNADTFINKILQGPRITFVTWLLFTQNTNGEAIEIEGNVGASRFILNFSGGPSAGIRFQVDSLIRTLDFSYPVALSLNVWYHIVYIHTEFGIKLYINKEDVTSSLTVGSSGTNITDTPYSTFGPEIANTSKIGNLTGARMKNTMLTGQPFDLNQVISNYDATFDTDNYVSWEILGEINDNFQPLDYFGTPTPSQQVCYELELTHLVLPNVILKSGFGNLIAFYPYVYVEFSNNNSLLQQYFYSNNPNARTVMFKVPITDTSTPERATFVNNRSNMNILTKFNPNDNFNFAVYLPNGDLFETSESDTTPPLPPNFFLQISATIGFKSVTL